jgi:hypothetical protein
MFKLTKSPTFWMTVAGDEQTESGRRVEFKFELKVKRITFPELSDLLRAAADEGRSDFEAIKDLVLDWRGIGNDDGEPLAYSPEALQDLMAVVGGAPIIRALIKAMPKAKEKN